MGFSYRQRKGPFNFSASKRGQRALPLLLALVALLLLPSCSADTEP